MPSTSATNDHGAQQKRNHKEPARKQETEHAVWNVPEWSAALNLGRSTYYTLSIRPRSIKIGKRHLIVESPAAYVERLAAIQKAAA